MPESDAAAAPGLSWSRCALLGLAHALLFVAGFPPLGLVVLPGLAPWPLAWLALRAASGRRAVATAFVAQCAMFLWLNRWMVDVTGLGYPLLCIYQACFGAAFVALVRGWSRAPRLRRIPGAIVVPLVWVGLEAARGKWLFTGYPWFLVGHPVIEIPALAQSADLLGVYLTSLIAVTGAGVLTDLTRWRLGLTSGRAALAAVVVVGAVHAANVAYGAWRLHQTPASTTRPGPRILAIQTNLPQDNKVEWTIEQRRADVATFVQLTRDARAAVEGPVDLIVWPETMLPVRGLDLETLNTLARYVGGEDDIAFAEAIIGLSVELDTPILVGAPCVEGLDVDPDTKRWIWTAYYNAAYLVERGVPDQRYDKCLLTPFGEVIPYVWRWPALEAFLVGLGAEGQTFQLDPNPDVHRFDLEGGRFRFASPICYEAVMGRVTRRLAQPGGTKTVDVLVNLSNDGWFGAFDAGRAQHVQITRFRAIENRMPLVRSVNTGYSVGVDSAGKVVAKLGDGRYGEGRRAGWVLAETRLDDRATLYGRVGDALAWICLALTGILAVTLGFGRLRRSRRGQERHAIDQD